MKKLLIVSALVLTACSPAPTVVLRIDCGEYNNKDLQVTINNEVAGTCPLDTMIRHGETFISARKDSEDASYLYSEVTEKLAENAMKRIRLEFKTIYPEPYYFNKATDISGINRYLAEFPEGKNAPKLREKLEIIYLENAKDVVGIDNYLAKFPEGKYAIELREKLESIYFLKAVDIKGAQAYLNKYPSGKNTAEIQKKLAQLVEEKRIADEKSKAAAIEKIRKDMLTAGFVDNNDGTVTSIKTKLIWQRCSVGQRWTGETCAGEAAGFNWNDAMKLAKDGWRLPTVDELDTLVFCSSNQRRSSLRPNGRYIWGTNGQCLGNYNEPTLNQSAFPNTPYAPAHSNWFLSSSPDAHSSNKFWSIHFQSGTVADIRNVDDNGKDHYYRVRLVRDGH